MPVPRTAFVLATVLAVVVVLAVHAVDFPGSVPRFERLSGGGVLLDAVPSFSVNGVYSRLSGYGEQGRASYWSRNLTVDVLLPLSVLPLLLLLARRAGERFQGKRLLPQLLLVLPFAYVAFDFVENAQVLVLLSNYPLRMDAIAGVLPYVTSVKRLASLLAIFVPLSILVFGLCKQRRVGPAA